ncbi:hypothetical protein PAXRUDRAFT_222669 [Paxillus rubicundulus Ve08.2h10]|uniref:Uncharacterized protein n=1 Tax=Paxillus rubicundulus Ve08.2h10 TaxID=930991 RepID=A0A0D0DH52_9AGAM|nr:hypothetical protein PAXRUDRAFT_222669 [Paxillus rubicundulus Ve08.2h10]
MLVAFKSRDHDLNLCRERKYYAIRNYTMPYSVLGSTYQSAVLQYPLLPQLFLLVPKH